MRTQYGKAANPLWYQIPAIMLGVLCSVMMVMMAQIIMTIWPNNMPILIISVVAMCLTVIVATMYSYNRFQSIWFNNNGMYLSDDTNA